MDSPTTGNTNVPEVQESLLEQKAPRKKRTEKQLEWDRAYRKKNYNRILDSCRQWRLENADHIRAYAREWHRNNKDKVKKSRTKSRLKDPAKFQEQARAYKRKNLERIRARNNAYTKRTKVEVIANYGGVCLCCFEQQVDFLTIDHVNNGRGNPAVRPSGNGSAFYAWLKARKFPKNGLQVLCFQCNWAKGIYGSCPHSKLKTPIDSFLKR